MKTRKWVKRVDGVRQRYTYGITPKISEQSCKPDALAFGTIDFGSEPKMKGKEFIADPRRDELLEVEEELRQLYEESEKGQDIEPELFKLNIDGKKVDIYSEEVDELMRLKSKGVKRLKEELEQTNKKEEEAFKKGAEGEAMSWAGEAGDLSEQIELLESPKTQEVIKAYEKKMAEIEKMEPVTEARMDKIEKRIDVLEDKKKLLEKHIYGIFNVGDKIEANPHSPDPGRFRGMKGKVTKARDDGNYVVKFDEGNRPGLKGTGYVFSEEELKRNAARQRNFGSTLSESEISDFKKTATYKLLSKRGQLNSDKEITDYLNSVKKFYGKNPIIPFRNEIRQRKLKRGPAKNIKPSQGLVVMQTPRDSLGRVHGLKYVGTIPPNKASKAKGLIE